MLKEHRAKIGRCYGEDIKVLSYDFLEQEKVVVNILSDLHIGNPLTDEEKIVRYLKYVADHDNYLILNGDLIECVTRTSKGDIYQLRPASPDDQVDRVVDMLEPIRDRILGITSGNHELRSDGHDYSREIANRLGVPHSPLAILYILRVGRKPHNGKPFVYSVYQTHGSGTGTSPGSQAGAMDRYGRSVVADVVIVSHMHNSMVTATNYLIPDLYNKGLMEKRQVVILSPSFMRFGGYAARKGYRPPVMSMQEVVFYGCETVSSKKGGGGVEVRTCL